MSFSTAEFFMFLLAGLLVYYIIPKKIQWIWLLIISYVYYLSFSTKTYGYIIAVTIATYLCAIFIERINDKSDKYLAENKATMSRDERKAYKASAKKNKRRVVALSAIICFGLLGFVKYTNFIIENVDAFVLFVGHGQYFEKINILVPIGISYFVFQSFSYIMDVYQGKIKAEKNIFKYALFVSFFPQILEGPIGRFDKLATQLYEGHKFELINIQFGIQRVGLGLFKKFVIADRVSGYVTEVFANCQNYNGWYSIVAVLLYTIQMYADFAGAMDIVIGTAEMFGIKMSENFRQPFFSRSIAEFWRRWHITLGQWMKDYIFYPFSLSKSMNKFGKWGKKHLGAYIGKTLPICLANILIFIIVGIWHGAAWKYIIYGLFNGLIIAFSELLKPVYAKMLEFCHIDGNSKYWNVFKIIRTFFLVNVASVMERSMDVTGMKIMFGKIAGFRINQMMDPNLFELFSRKDFLIIFFACVLIFVISLLKEKHIDIRAAIASKPLVIRWAIYYGLIIITIVFGFGGTSGGFMYANF